MVRPSSSDDRRGLDTIGPALPIFFLTAIFLLVILGTPTSEAAPAPTNASVLQAYNQTSQGGLGDAWVARYNLTWRLSPDDTNQVSGALTYYVFENVTGADGGTVIDSVPGPGSFTNRRANLTPEPVPDNPGWVWDHITYTGCATPACTYQDNKSIRLYVLANDTIDQSAYPCSLVDTNISRMRYLNQSRPHAVRSHFQCGENLVNATSGLRAVVTHVGNGTSYDPFTQIDLYWRASTGDPNATGSGNWTYWYGAQINDAAGLFDRRCSSRDEVGFFRGRWGICDNDTKTAQDSLGIRHFTFQLGAPLAEVVSFQVMVENNATHQRSLASCIVAISSGRAFLERTCGSFGANAAGLEGTPSFPALDVPAFIAASGGSEATVAWLLAGVLFLVFAIGGFARAGPAGGGLGALVALPLAYVCYLIPSWFLVLSFFILGLALVFWPRGNA